MLEDEDRWERRLQITAKIREEERRIVLPLRWLGQIVAIALREAGVSTFRFSRRTGRHLISMHGKHDVREVALP